MAIVFTDWNTWTCETYGNYTKNGSLSGIALGANPQPESYMVVFGSDDFYIYAKRDLSFNTHIPRDTGSISDLPYTYSDEVISFTIQPSKYYYNERFEIVVNAEVNGGYVVGEPAELIGNEYQLDWSMPQAISSHPPRAYFEAIRQATIERQSVLEVNLFEPNYGWFFPGSVPSHQNERVLQSRMYWIDSRIYDTLNGHYVNSEPGSGTWDGFVVEDTLEGVPYNPNMQWGEAIQRITSYVTYSAEWVKHAKETLSKYIWLSAPIRYSSRELQFRHVSVVEDFDASVDEINSKDWVTPGSGVNPYYYARELVGYVNTSTKDELIQSRTLINFSIPERIQNYEKSVEVYVVSSGTASVLYNDIIGWYDDKVYSGVTKNLYYGHKYKKRSLESSFSQVDMANLEDNAILPLIIGRKIGDFSPTKPVLRPYLHAGYWILTINVIFKFNVPDGFTFQGTSFPTAPILSSGSSWAGSILGP